MAQTAQTVRRSRGVPDSLKDLLIHPTSSVREAIAHIDRNGKGIALVVDERRRLLGTVTDGDIRRAMLAGFDLADPVQALRERSAIVPNPHPVTALADTEPAALLRLMQERQVRQIPLLDKHGRVVGLVTSDDLLPAKESPLRAVVMAGGYGKRLRPLTNDLPKALLPMGERPLLELILHQLRQVGIRDVSLTTCYKAELIEQHFGDGREFGVEIRYIKEEEPLGTAGALSLLEPSDQPVLVINGDILTRVNFLSMWDFHREHEAEMTVAVRQQEFSVPYGVIEGNGVMVTGVSEKPMVTHFINAGIYLLEASACRLIPRGQRYDMTDLITRLVSDERRVVSFPIREYWLDIGHVENYQKALDDLANQVL